MTPAKAITRAAIITLTLAVSLPSFATPAPFHSASRATTSPAARAEIRFRVMAAFDLARRRIEKVPACGALFERLGRDGVATLAAGTFKPVGSAEGEHICRQRSAAAFTTIGGTETHICPASFLRLNRSEAAAILVHEALHQAGLSERPHSRQAPTSREINQMVRTACGI